MTANELVLDTKYYSSDVHLCVLTERTVVSASFAESVEAVVLHFDGASSDAYVQWLPFIKVVTEFFICRIYYFNHNIFHHNSALLQYNSANFAFDLNVNMTKLIARVI